MADLITAVAASHGLRASPTPSAARPPAKRPSATRPSVARAPVAARGAQAILVLAGSLAASTMSCAPEPQPVDPASHAVELDEWRAARHGDLLRTDGWLTLVGLFPLEEGSQTLGSAPDNDFVYSGSETPGLIGTFSLEDGLVRFDAAPGERVLNEGQEVTYAIMNPADVEPLVLESWPLQWSVLSRGSELAIRLKDADSSVRTEFTGIENFPTQVRWRLPARFIVHAPPLALQVSSVRGSVHEVLSPGSVEFEIEGETHRLVLWNDLDLWNDADDADAADAADDGPESFFTAFADTSNGEGTHADGRFLRVASPDEYGRTVVDFNKAYNPPCAFTAFADCPLPPLQNRITVAIEAGEKVYAEER